MELETLAMLVAGGFATLLIAVGELFLHDLIELDMLSRIFSFVIRGLLLIHAS